MSQEEIMYLTIPQFFMYRQCQAEAYEAREQQDKMDEAFRKLRGQ
jgi:hypothetical protein